MSGVNGKGAAISAGAYPVSRLPARNEKQAKVLFIVGSGFVYGEVVIASLRSGREQRDTQKTQGVMRFKKFRPSLA